MSFASVAMLLPTIIQTIDMLDDLVINGMNMVNRADLDPSDAADFDQMMAAYDRSRTKRETSLVNLRAKIDAARQQ